MADARRKWTDVEDDILKKYWKIQRPERQEVKAFDEKLSDILERTPKAISQRRGTIGLITDISIEKTTVEEKQAPKQMDLEASSDNATKETKVNTPTFYTKSKSTSPVVHNIKMHPVSFGRATRKEKTFFICRNEREYNKGDKLVLEEFEGKEYTGNSLFATITFVTNQQQKEGYVVFSYKIDGWTGIDHGKEVLCTKNN